MRNIPVEQPLQQLVMLCSPEGGLLPHGVEAYFAAPLGVKRFQSEGCTSNFSGTIRSRQSAGTANVEEAHSLTECGQIAEQLPLISVKLSVTEFVTRCSAQQQLLSRPSLPPTSPSSSGSGITSTNNVPPTAVAARRYLYNSLSFPDTSWRVQCDIVHGAITGKRNKGPSLISYVGYLLAVVVVVPRLWRHRHGGSSSSRSRTLGGGSAVRRV